MAAVLRARCETKVSGLVPYKMSGLLFLEVGVFPVNPGPHTEPSTSTAVGNSSGTPFPDSAQQITDKPILQ
jgi:hypothetical protein